MANLEEIMPQMNLNEFVWVKLTPAGRQQYEKQFSSLPEKMKGTVKTTPEVDRHGFSQFSLWNLMNIFGEKLFNGSRPDEHPFEGNMIWLSKPLV